MRNYITIDGGTTNTRVGLLSDRELIDTIKLPIGAQASIGNREQLRLKVEEAVREIASRHPELKIESILATGMITSEFGLREVPHRVLPAGVRELHDNLCKTEMFGYPISFIPGVKTRGDDILTTDFMRGEESELAGILDSLPPELTADAAVVLPGSHSKLIFTDKDRRISSVSSFLTGEMIAALSGSTILKAAVNLNIPDYDPHYLKEGYKLCRREGINGSLLKVRILKNLFGAGDREVYSFFLGIVLEAEIRALADCGAERLIIAGRKQIKEPMAQLLREFSSKEIITVDEETVNKSVFLGMKKIYEYEA